MTMLDRMRRHRNWLKWSLALVCLAFVIFYIPDFLAGTTPDLATIDTVASVEGREITGTEFLQTYRSQMQAYRSAYGGSMSEQLLRQLGVDQQILSQMVDERAALAEADRLDITVTDQEVRQAILSMPGLQENGAFIGEQRYRQLLAQQRPPITTAQFEASIRSSLVVERLRSTVTGWLSVSDAELEDEYRRRNEKVKLAVVAFPSESFRPDVTAGDDEVAAYFESHLEDFRVPENRKIRYVLIDVEALRASVVVPASEIERAYNDNFELYTAPDEIRASHILFRLEDKDESAVRSTAEDVLRQARDGADFGALATQYSEDEATAPNGGDLDFFERGRMVPEFDEAAFALEVDQISDVVQTPFGFHIIKLTDRRGGVTQTLEDVRDELTQRLSREIAQSQATDMAQRLAPRITTAADLDTIGAGEGLTVQESDFFARDEPIPGLGPAPEVAARAFTLSEGEVAGPLTTSLGFVFASVSGTQDSYIPELDEVMEQVRDEVLGGKAVEVARERAAALAPRLKTASDFDAAAQAGGFSADTTDFITRDSPIPNLGMAPQVTDAAFSLAAGSVSDPIETEQGTAIVKVLEKQEVTPTELESNKGQFRQEMLSDRRNRFFAAYMTKAKQKMSIQVNAEAVRRIIG